MIEQLSSLRSMDLKWKRRFTHRTQQKSALLSLRIATRSIPITKWQFSVTRREDVIFDGCLIINVAPEIPKIETPEAKKEEEKVEEKKAVAAASKSTVERKAKYDPLTAVYRSIPDEEPTPYSFSSTLPELYSLDLDVLRLTAQYTAVNGQKVFVVREPED